MTRTSWFGLIVLLALGTTPLVAQVERSGGGQAQKFMQQYQQLAAEKTALEGRLAQTKQDLDTANATLEAVKKERDALKTKAAAGPAISASAVSQLTTEKDTAQKNLEQYKQRMGELVTRFRETATNLKDVEADRSRLAKELDERNGAYDKCAADNLQLYEINGDILNRYDHVGLFTKVSAAEPFTKITRTRIDNLVVEYRARALELRAKKRDVAPSP
jgi:chromosome segregation ATPase